MSILAVDIDVGDVNFIAGPKSLTLLRKLASTFQPVNCGELLHHRFVGKTAALRCGRHLYLTVASLEDGSAVYQLDRRPMT